MSERHAVVTGGGKGIGAATAQALSNTGFRVTVMGRDVVALEAVAARLKSGTAVEVDVTDAGSVQRAFASVGPVDILVNNAGAARSVPFVRTTLDLWNSML